MNITFHADDIGMTEHITETIVGAWNAGLLEGFSVLPNGAALENVSRALRETPQREARIYAHLNLYEGKAISPRDTIPLITDSEGNLNCTWGSLLAGWALGRRAWRNQLLEQVEREWRAQLEKVIVVCAPRNIVGVDGHLHMHMLPFLFPIASRLARSFEIGEIRISREAVYLSADKRDTVRTGFLANLLKYILLNWCARPARRVARENGLDYPDGVLGVLYSGRMSYSAVKAGLSASERVGLKSVQVILHIGRAEAGEASFWESKPNAGRFPMSEEREAEYRALQRLRGND